MKPPFSNIPFQNPARAEADLKLLQQRLPARLWNALPALLAHVPDPDGAVNYLERYLGADGAEAAVRYIARNPTALHYLLVIFSYSRFLSETLIQQPDLAVWLHKPARLDGGRQFRGGIERVKSQEDLDEEFARFATTASDQPPAVVLARFKRREYLRITLRDVLGLATLAETTLELSVLADVLLARALRISEQKLEAAHGIPQCADLRERMQRAQVTILALGKLGAQELNYSSDIDLMFLHTGDGETTGGSAGVIPNAEYFVRLAQGVLKLVAEVTPEGALYRVDLRLRPQGSAGDLAISFSAALDYYRSRAREWELQMLIKARGSAGDIEAGRRFLRELYPLIFRPEFNVAAVEAVLNARQQMTRSLTRAEARTAQRQTGMAGHIAAINVKLSPGGIRDIEFLTQCLQRVYGGAEPWLTSAAAASTLVALQRLHDKGHISGQDFFRLGAAYQFLRIVEHRLQLRDGVQRHTLPDPESFAPGALERLARRCGLEAAEGRTGADLLLERTRKHFAEVREIYERILLPQKQEPAPSAEAAFAETAPAGAEAGALLPRLRREYPDVAREATRVITSGDAYARRGLLSFLSAAALDRNVMKQIEAHPEWIARAAEIFSRSDLAVEMLSRNAEEIAAIADPELAGFRGLLFSDTGGDVLAGMAALRVAYRRAVMAMVVRAVLGGSAPFDTFETLTRLADEALAGATQLAIAGMGGKGSGNIAQAPFAVIALGRLGTREMDIGSDVDVVFVAEERRADAGRGPWRQLAERFVQVVSSHTREGLLFPVDTRLRPRGAEGEMVQSPSYLCEYLAGEAQGWEAASYLKARVVAGNMAFGAEVLRQMWTALAARWGTADGVRELAQQLARMREKLEKEGTGPRARTEFKHFRGGFYDVEYTVALLFFRAVRAGARTLENDFPCGNTPRQISLLKRGGLLDSAQAGTLQAVTLFYRSLDHATRLVTGYGVNRPPEPALAERIVRLLAQWQVPLPAHDATGLNAALQKTRDEARAIFEQVVLKTANGAAT